MRSNIFLKIKDRLKRIYLFFLTTKLIGMFQQIDDLLYWSIVFILHWILSFKNMYQLIHKYFYLFFSKALEIWEKFEPNFKKNYYKLEKNISECVIILLFLIFSYWENFLVKDVKKSENANLPNSNLFNDYYKSFWELIPSNILKFLKWLFSHKLHFLSIWLAFWFGLVLLMIIGFDAFLDYLISDLRDIDKEVKCLKDILDANKTIIKNIVREACVLNLCVDTLLNHQLDGQFFIMNDFGTIKTIDDVLFSYENRQAVLKDWSNPLANLNLRHQELLRTQRELTTLGLEVKQSRDFYIFVACGCILGMLCLGFTGNLVILNTVS